MVRLAVRLRVGLPQLRIL